MSELTLTPPVARPASARRPSGGRTAALAAAGVLAVTGFGAGGLALWGDGQKDADGFLTTETHRLATDRGAIATDTLDLDAGAPGFVDADSYGKVRLRVASRDGRPVFVGIAPARDVSAYLDGTDHTRLTDMGSDPFDADFDDHAAARSPAPPATQGFWEASASGAGAQTLTWDARDGDWSVVVMNADASPRVDADVRAGADVPVLDDIAWAGIATGVAAALAAAGIVLTGRRRTPRA